MRGQVRVAIAVFAMALMFGATAAKAAGGTVYLLRGGFNVFSTGMDEIAEKLRAKGVNAVTDGHANWQSVAERAAAQWKKDHKPIVLVGHSWGANADILVADYLREKDVPVALILLFDPTAPMKVPANVKRLVNYYSTTAAGQGLDVQKGFGFGGRLENDPQPVGHLDIDNWVPLQEKAIAEIQKVMRGR